MVVDVLSFTTTLTVAVERGIAVYPYRWKDERATAYAGERDAVLAVGRSVRAGVSLSPASVRQPRASSAWCCRRRTGRRSPLGLAESGRTVVGASLRNRSAVARWLPAEPGGGRRRR